MALVPTVARIDGLRVVIYPNDHRPAHIHVIGQGCEAVFMLNCPSGPPVLRESLGFGRSQLVRIERSLDEMLQTLCADWGGHPWP